jgi:hypothetical protein
MGEDYPLHPNQVSPPQEGQLDQPQETQSDQADHDQQPAAEAQPLQDDSEATPVETDASDDDRQPATYIRNEDRARAMARAEKLKGGYGYKPDGGASHRRMNAGIIEDAVQKAGDEYEVGEIAERDGKTPEEVRKLLSRNRKAFLDYSRAIIENQNQYGDKLSPNYVALEAVYELADRYPELIEAGHLDSRDMSIAIKHSSVVGGALNIDINHYSEQEGNIYKEGWTAPALNSVSSWRKYEATSHSDEDPDFDSVTTIKRRSMREEDAQRLKDLLAGANFDPEPEDHYQDDDFDDEAAQREEDDNRRELAFQKDFDQTGDWEGAQRRAGVTPRA